MALGGLNTMGKNERIMKGQKGIGAEQLRGGHAEKIDKRIFLKKDPGLFLFFLPLTNFFLSLFSLNQ